ncbi:unnamed protein product, partial [Closterium sp. NIES-54]
PYKEEEIKEIIKIRCLEEAVDTSPDALDLLSKIGVETSLRYAIHLITSAHLAATRRRKGGSRGGGGVVVEVEDVSRVYTLFADVKRYVRRARDSRALRDSARGACRSPCRADPAVSSPRRCSPCWMPPPSSPCAVSSPRGLACTVASPAHARHAALVPARRVSHRLPDALHLQPPSQPTAPPPRPTRHATACYPTRPPVGPAVAAEFAPAVWGEGGAAVEPCCAAALAAACSCSPGGLPPHAPTSAVPPPLPPHAPPSTASTLAEGLVQLNLLPLHRLSLLLPAVAIFSALGVPLQEEYSTWF